MTFRTIFPSASASRLRLGAGLSLLGLALLTGCTNKQTTTTTTETTTETSTETTQTPATTTESSTSSASPSGLSMTGAGASFPFPLYSKMFAEYQGAKVNYQSVGSGSGQKQIIERTVDFAGSDNPMSDEQMKGAPGTLLHIPTAIGAVVPAYNLPGVSEPVKFDGAALADIYLGKIKTWNDPALLALNPGLKLPGLPITVARRSDGSGTTYVWSDYLSSNSEEWLNKVGRGNSLQWPTGTGAKGNDGVAGVIRGTPGAIGYTELVYAKQNGLSYGAVKNGAGNFVQADLASSEAAAEGVEIPDDTRVSLVSTTNPDAYPIASFTYLIFYKDQNYGGRSREQGQALKNLLSWVLTDGQQYHEALDYAPLPANVVEKAQNVVNGMTYGEEAL